MYRWHQPFRGELPKHLKPLLLLVGTKEIGCRITTYFPVKCLLKLSGGNIDSGASFEGPPKLVPCEARSSRSSPAVANAFDGPVHPTCTLRGEIHLHTTRYRGFRWACHSGVRPRAIRITRRRVVWEDRL
jgi:hypothetical protein